MNPIQHYAFRTVFSGIISFLSVAMSSGQFAPQTMVVGPDGKPIQVNAVPGAMTPPGAKPATASKPKDVKKEESKKENDSPEPKVIRRGDQPEGDANPEELKASVGEDGRVAFQFRNQPWIDLVKWLSQIAEQPLDWQELPGDRVNLSSPGRYTVDETKDLFNRHLLARGYTLLDLPGGITVAKTAGINPAMVPRVAASQLASLMPHTFVRASLELGWLQSEKLAEELKPMISSNGRLTPLSTTNRIEAMDAAVNLAQIAALIDRERSQDRRDALAPEFRLRHISAESAKQMLEEFLGVEKKKAPAPMSPQQIQMMQQMGQQNPGQMQAAKKPEISIVANPRQNSILVRAPADRIAVATEFINRIDVPGQGMRSLADVESSVQVYRLFTLEPEKLIEILDEMNVLEPTTRIRPGDENGALIVSGSAADRFIIERLIKRLDSSGRQFEVLQLRRLEANEVAQSIAFLMGKDDKKDESNNSRRFFYFPFGGGQDEKKEKDEFRVAANTRFRQVLLWANETEMEQVRNLLVKLGELPPPGGSRSTIRRVQASSGPETHEYLLRLRAQWNAISDTPLDIPSADQFVDPIADEEAEEPEESNAEEADLETTSSKPQSGKSRPGKGGDPAETTLTAMFAGDEEETQRDDQSGAGSDLSPDNRAADPSKLNVRSAEDFDRLFKPRDARPETKPAPEKMEQSPIRIELDSEGNLVLLGKNTEALDRLESLMLRVAPPRRPYEVFKIKYQSAFFIKLNLEDYFEEEEDDDSSEDSFYRYLFDISQPQDDGPAGLGKSNELRFVDDPDTNTIVVSGATSSQLKTIRELVELWDVEEPSNKRRMRYTKLVRIEYGNAAQIAETVKEAYRDLLSSNDKAFAQGGQRGGVVANQSGAKQSGRSNQGSGLVDSENGRDGGDVDFSFKGKLSMGVDPIGNTLLVSAEGEPLLDLVEEMIMKLDKAAQPAGSVQVLTLSGNASEESIEGVLRAFGAGASTSSNGSRRQRPQGQVAPGGMPAFQPKPN
ncbi:MAG: secretin N-terminal domain-containing protein [Planctomycetota bacterium]